MAESQWVGRWVQAVKAFCREKAPASAEALAGRRGGAKGQEITNRANGANGTFGVSGQV
jgi:hypothetical protein